MLAYDFLKLINGHIRTFRQFPLPVVMCDRELTVYWSNDLAKRLFPHITETQGLRSTLAEFPMHEAFLELEQRGNCTIHEIFLMSNISMSLSPIYADDDAVAGAVIMLMGTETTLDADDFYRTTQTAQALSNSMRETANDIFSVMDVAAAKADLLNTPWIKSSFQQISLSTYHMLRSSQNLTEYAKIQSGTFDLALRDTNLKTSIQHKTAISKELCGSFGVPLHLELCEEDFYARLDVRKSEIAFFNVLHNALYFTKPDNEISIRTVREGEWCTLTISDRGCGIPPQVLEHVTEPYFSYSHNGKGCGIGLGLTLAKNIITAHEGEFRVDSTAGKGTTVTIRLRENYFTHSIPLAQDTGDRLGSERFSTAYVGLSDVVLSPYRTQ